MSIKTLRKRIALVAVSALGASIFSVIAAPVASASVDEANSAICSEPVSGASYVVPLGGSVVIAIDDAEFVEFRGANVVPTVLAYAGDTDVVSSLNTLGRVTLQNPTDVGGAVAYTQLTATTLGATSLVFGATSTPTAISTNTIKITVVASCTTGSVAAAKTKAQLDTVPDTTPNIGVDVTRFAAGDDAFISIEAKNAYDAFVPTATWVATATNGALVAIDTVDTNLTGVDAKGSASFATASSDGDGVFVRVDSSTPASASSTVVTVSYAGQVVATKTINWDGEVKTINVVATTIGRTSNSGAIWYTLADAAGNLTSGSVSGLATTYGAQITNVTNQQDARIVAAAPSGTINGIANSTLLPSTAYGIAMFSCGANSGSAKVTLEHENVVSEATISREVTLTCAGGLDTYTVSMDKASYAVGDIATLTITAKDSKGNPVNDYINTNGGTFGSGAAADISVGGGSLTKAAANSDTFGTLAGLPAGTKTYKIQLTTAGSFNTVVNLGGSTTKSATVGYTVGSGSVSNAEVLAAIVKLIASINKQIRALQKSLRR